MLNKKDIQTLHNKGLNPADIEKQITNFKNGFPFVHLVSSATAGHGVTVLTDEEIEELETFYDSKMASANIIKFVPASGAASRMFKHLFEFALTYDGSEKAYQAFLADQGFNSVYNFITSIHNFAFYKELQNKMKKDGFDIEPCIEKRDYKRVIDYVLNPEGLNYTQLPKGLIQFHDYADGARMSVEEHMVETAHYCKDKNGKVALHFTVSPEHHEKFLDAIKTVQPKYEKLLNVNFELSFSFQKPSTDTLAVDMGNHPFRDESQNLVFRPGGHGALIENLNDIDHEIVFIKNIDNIVPDKLREPTYQYKKVIGAILIQARDETFKYLHLLKEKELSDDDLNNIADFAINVLCVDLPKRFNNQSFEVKKKFLFDKLNRPIRVCGMVKNEGEPGGGPFWVKRPNGEISLQIVEKSQINAKEPGQLSILNRATHFNPVDLVCSIRDYQGHKFDLRKYIDPTTGFISVKSKNGKNLKAQELPGLWNGAMADWNTIFVEIPIITFNPVKTVNDLLRPNHQ